MSTNLSAAAGAARFASSGDCAGCGFGPDRVSPTDAVASLRSFPRRWRSALAVHLDDHDPEAVLAARISPADWTPLEHAGHVRDVLHALDIRLQRILREDEPVLPETHVTPPSGANEQGLAVVLAALSVSADQIARTVEQTPAASWRRTARRAGRTISALDLAREAVHEGNHHLREAVDSLQSLRRSHTAVS